MMLMSIWLNDEKTAENRDETQTIVFLEVNLKSFSFISCVFVREVIYKYKILLKWIMMNHCYKSLLRVNHKREAVYLLKIWILIVFQYIPWEDDKI